MHSSSHSWRHRMGRLTVHGAHSAQSTESEAETSAKEWSDQWRDSPDPRPSWSSSDETRPRSPSSALLGSHARSSTPLSVSNRRQTITRLHSATSHSHTGGRTGTTAPLNTATATASASGSPSTIVNIEQDVLPAGSASASGSNGYTSPPPYPDTSRASSPYPRSRRRSISLMTSASFGPSSAAESEPSPVEKYASTYAHTPPVASPGAGSYSKSKKKKTRAASFSLPFHKRRHMGHSTYASYARWLGGRWRPLHRWILLGILTSALLVGLYLWKSAYELQVELSLFSHKWIKEEFDAVLPLKGCFAPERISPLYDIQRHLAPKYQMLSPGLSLKRGTTCYDFSSTVQPVPGVEPEHLLYHTYWRADLIPFGERHTATLASFLATQPLSHSKMILWTNGAETLGNNTFVKPFVEKWGDHIEVRQVDMPALTRGTEIDGLLSNAGGGGIFDQRAWVDGDAIRLLVLWHYGGVWMDMDQILTRDIHPLVEHEFVTQWDCYDKPYFSLNGALMHFRQHSPYLCEAFHIMATSPLPKPNTFTWGSHLYSKLHRRLLAARQKPFSVLPWCFADPRNCRSDIRFPDPFLPDPEYWAGRHWEGRDEVGRSGRELLEEKVGYVWTVHLHNQWKKGFPKGGWVQRLLEGYWRQINELERYAQQQQQQQQSSGAAGDGEEKEE